MKSAKILRIGFLGGAIVLLCAFVAASSWHTTPLFHSSIPAGYDVLRIQPTGAVLSFLGLIECPELEGAQQIAEGTNAKIIDADGKRLIYFPRNFSFRITATLRKTVLAEPTDSFDIPEDPKDLLLQLKFRLKTYHGLATREIQPESVQIIGVPADVPAEERIYRVNFSVDDMPVSDRCVLEVLSPSGERLTRFHFDLL